MDNKEFNKDYRSFMISKWASSKIESFKKPTQLDFETQYKYYINLLSNYFPNKKDIEILEIGCGWGGFIYSLRKSGFLKVDAIDIIPECCEFVSKEFGINCKCIDALNFFEKNDKKYDIIAAFDVIEHFNKNEIVVLITQIFNSLNENGKFIMRVPNGGSLNGLYIRYSGFTHELAFTPLSINELFKAIGFQKVCCIPEPEPISNPIKHLFKKVLKKFTARLLSIDPNFINSPNIIGIGYK